MINLLGDLFTAYRLDDGVEKAVAGASSTRSVVLVALAFLPLLSVLALLVFAFAFAFIRIGGSVGSSSGGIGSVRSGVGYRSLVGGGGGSSVGSGSTFGIGTFLGSGGSGLSDGVHSRGGAPGDLLSCGDGVGGRESCQQREYGAEVLHDGTVCDEKENSKDQKSTAWTLVSLPAYPPKEWLDVLTSV